MKPKCSPLPKFWLWNRIYAHVFHTTFNHMFIITSCLYGCSHNMCCSWISKHVWNIWKTLTVDRIEKLLKNNHEDDKAKNIFNIHCNRMCIVLQQLRQYFEGNIRTNIYNHFQSLRTFRYSVSDVERSRVVRIKKKGKKHLNQSLKWLVGLFLF